MSNTQVTPAAGRPAGFLPVPQVPGRPRDLPEFDTVAGLTGLEVAEPLVRIEEAYSAAQAAVAAVTDNRPGGAGFNEALGLDVADRVAGEARKRLRVEVLVDGDRRRWAEAVVACRAADEIGRKVRGELDKAVIGKAARAAAVEAAADWATAASAGWEARTDKGAAWGHRSEGDAALARYSTAMRLLEWATGTPGPDLPSRREVRIPDVTLLPPDPAARGAWLALELVTEPTTTWLHLPNEVVFPDGAENLVINAIPENADRWTALRGPGYVAQSR